MGCGSIASSDKNGSTNRARGATASASGAGRRQPASKAWDGSTGFVAATILLKSGGAQTGKTVSLKRFLPAQELLLRQLVAAAGLLSGQPAVCHGGHDRGLAADRPPFDVDRRQHPPNSPRVRYFGIVAQSSCHPVKWSNLCQKFRRRLRLALLTNSYVAECPRD
jgi:hypothetical protein